MVEKVFISPNRVRAYGNIINMKTGDDFTLVNSELTVTTDTVDGAEMTVFQFEVEGGISIALVSSASTCNVGDNVLLTATVLDDSAPVEAAEVTFKVGDTVLGTDETDANGVATYTYTASTVGSFSFTAVYQDSTSPVVSVSVNHSYSLAFSQATYTASGGSVTLECTLLEDNVAKTGASVTVTGSDGSVYNGITNSNGVASVTVTGIIADTTFTATYSNVTDTCTVTSSSYIVDISGMTDQSNEFGTILNFRSTGSAGSGSMSYDSTNHYYVFASTNTGQERFIPITALTGLNNFKLTFEAQVVTTHLFGFGEFVGSTNTNCSVFIGTDTNKFTKHQGSDIQIASGATQATWYSFTVTVDSTGYYVTIKDLNDNVKVDNYRCTISNSNTTQYGFTWGWQGTSQRFYLRNIKAEAL